MTSSNALAQNNKFILLNNLESKQSVNEILPAYVILQKKKMYQKIPQKRRPEKALLHLQRIKHNIYWKMELLKQTTYIRYVLAKLSKIVQISTQTSSDSLLHRILRKSKWAWN